MTTEPTNFKELFRRSLVKINELKAQLASRDPARSEPIAVVGMACRLPGGSSSPESFWQALLQGVDTVGRLPPERWLAEALASELPEAKWASLLCAIEDFDAVFFGISPREATSLDPQQRLLLEVAWEALESAGLPAAGLVGSRTGVFVGLWNDDYKQLIMQNGAADTYVGTGCLHSTATGRLSYVLGLQGPCMSVDTACSSSLVTVHLACQSLRLGESDLALAGGVNVILDPRSMTTAANMRAISPDGHCKSFDARANGYVRGEGCGLVVLKRLADAQRDGDPILAVILGTAVNQDGRSTGLTVPNVLAQQALLREALHRAGLGGGDIGYVETHGTGTPLGDPIEFEALREVLGAPQAGGTPCVLGAVKTNIGHTETAAGVTGLIKAVLCLEHEMIPKNLHFETLNPRISLEGTRFVIPTENQPWPLTPTPRRAGVSAFGIGGTNAHVILQEAPKNALPPVEAEPGACYVLPLSAKTPAALAALVESYGRYLPHTAVALGDLAYTASCRRSHLEHRLAVVGNSVSEVAAALAEYAAGKKPARVHQGKTETMAPQVVLVFSGQGAQWAGMGKELLQQSPRFRQAVNECEQWITRAGGDSVVAELEKPEDESLLHRTEVAQPALFALQVGLLAELRAYGVEPALVIGHSVGEVAAAYAAGMLDLETACRVVVARARGMQDLAGRGKMFAVELTEAQALAALHGESSEVAVAAVNGPRSVVLAGETAALQQVIKKLEQAGTVAKELRVDYAFHSPQMQAAEQAFRRVIGQVAASRGTVKMVSTVTGQELKGTDCNAAYWGRNIRQPVRFAQAVAAATQVSGRVFVEVGPHPVLSAEIGEQLAAAGYPGRVIPMLRRHQGGRLQLLSALAALHVQGVPLRWAADFVAPRRVVPLPSYPWQRQRYFAKTAKPQAKQPGIASQYYDAVTKLVESVQGDHEVADKHDLYLTFAPFAEILPNFSWMKIIARPQDYQEQARLVQQKQQEMRQVLFRHVDFAACARALDFGCGFSTDVLHLAQQHPRLQLDGYTISAEQAEVGQRRLREQGLDSRVQVYCRDSAKDPFPGKYDLVFGFEVAHHIKDKAALFANIGDHLQPAGTLVLADFISHVAFEIEHDASSSFFLTVEQWTELLSGQQLQVQDVVDVSRQISNFLFDPQFDAHLEQMRQAGEDENVIVSFQSYDRLGKMFDRGLASYILLSAKKVEGKNPEELKDCNRLALTNLLAYAAETEEETEESQLLYGVEWRRAALPAAASASADWLLVATRKETTAPLAKLLSQQGARCVRVHAGSGYAQVGTDCYQMQLSTASFRRLLQEAFGHEKPCARAVYLSALEMPEPGAAAELGNAVVELCSEATNLAQALVTHGFRTVPRLYLVTQGAQAVEGSGPVRVVQAPLCGLGKTIALEHPELRCTRLDLDPAAPVDAEGLVREMSGADREDQVALRRGERYVARVVRTSARGGKSAAEGSPIRGDRSYLITGGLGGLGLSLARWLVAQGAGLVFLAGRKQPDEPTRQQLQELNQDGVRVLGVQADVAQEQQVTQVLAQIEQSGKPLAGVFHAAGVLHDKTLLEQTRESFYAVVAPKVMGAWNLHRQVKAEDLDFFVMYSSTAALCGSPGQGNYCAANAFLDALAQQRVAQGKKGLSIQWGAFSEVGMAVAQDNRGKRVAGLGLASLTPGEGHRLLAKLLPSPLASVAVMRLNARQWIETKPSAAGLPFFSDLVKGAGQGSRLNKAARKMLERLSGAPDYERQALMAEHLSEQFGAVLQQEPGQLDPQAPFQSLGVDSLMSLEIRNRLEESLGVRLGATVLYTYANLAALNAHLLESLGLGRAAESAEKEEFQPDSSGQDQSRLDKLSDEDLALMGETLLA